MKQPFLPFFKPYDSVKQKSVYISGPMTGYRKFNAPAFAKCTAALRELGYAVCSPSETDQILGTLTHEEYLRFDFARVLEADFVVALEGWQYSDGARAELVVAARIGIPIWSWENWTDYHRIRYPEIMQAVSYE